MLSPAADVDLVLGEVEPEGTCRNFGMRREPPLHLPPPEPTEDGICYIALTRGLFASVDAQDCERVNWYKWCVSGSGNRIGRSMPTSPVRPGAGPVKKCLWKGGGVFIMGPMASKDIRWQFAVWALLRHGRDAHATVMGGMPMTPNALRRHCERAANEWTWQQRNPKTLGEDPL